MELSNIITLFYATSTPYLFYSPPPPTIKVYLCNHSCQSMYGLENFHNMLKKYSVYIKYLK